MIRTTTTKLQSIDEDRVATLNVLRENKYQLPQHKFTPKSQLEQKKLRKINTILSLCLMYNKKIFSFDANSNRENVNDHSNVSIYLLLVCLKTSMGKRRKVGVHVLCISSAFKLPQYHTMSKKQDYKDLSSVRIIDGLINIAFSSRSFQESSIAAADLHPGFCKPFQL